MGTPDYASEILNSLIEDEQIKVVGVFTQPDKPVGRKQTITPPHVKQFLMNKNSEIPIYQPVTLKDEKIELLIKNMNLDFIVVAAYGQILPKNILNIAPCINLHASLLPKYRGASPIQSSILNHDNYTGVSAMLMNEGLDTGDILSYIFVKIEKDIIVNELFEKLSKSAAILCINTLKNWKNIKPIKQINALSSYAKKIRKSDGEIILNDSKEIFTKFKAFNPWPGIYLSNGLKLKKIQLSDMKNTEKPGEILYIGNDNVIISCKIGAIDLLMVQAKSKREMSAKEYIMGKRLKVGDNIL